MDALEYSSGDTADSAAYLYERVGAHVRDLIRDGTLQPGDRVPSLRTLCRRLGVSMATATRAYEDLEAAGWIEARPQSGFYVRRPRACLLATPDRGDPPARAERVDVASILQRLASEPKDTADVVSLSIADPDPELLPARELQRSLARVARLDAAESIRYTFAPGVEPLRRQIAYRATDAGCRIHPDEVLITSGCTEALAVALHCVARPGAVVAVESPTFFNILTLIQTLGMRALELPTDPQEGLDLDALERQLDRGAVDAVLTIPNFSNPLGSCMSDAGKRRLAELAARHGVPVIEDDIYGELYFGDRRPTVVRAFAAETGATVLTASSFSKTIAPGYRVGWLLAGSLQERAEGVKHALTLASATPPQLAIADFLDGGGCERLLRRVRRRYREQVERMRLAVSRHFPAGTRVTDPRGGFLLWVELPAGVDGVAVYRAALADGIRVAPGRLFSTSSAYDRYLRLACASAWTPAIDDAIRRLGRIVAEASAGADPAPHLERGIEP